MEWPRQTGDRPALREVVVGPAAPAASTEGDHCPHPLHPGDQASDESNELWCRRVELAKAQALAKAFAFTFNSSSSSDKKPTSATELWSPRGLRRHQNTSPNNRSGRNRQPSRAAKGSFSTTPTDSSLFSARPPTSPTRRPLSAPLSSVANIMEVNVVPSVVLHFHGFRSSLLSNLTTACYRILLDMVHKSLELVVAFVAVVMVVATIKSLVCCIVYWTFQCVGFVVSVLTTFLTSEAIAVFWGNKHSELFHDEDSEPVVVYTQPVSPLLKPAPMAVAVPTLPRLNLPASIAVVPERDLVQEKMLLREMITENSVHPLFPRPTGQLLATRRRILGNLRELPSVNAVRGDRRRRPDVVLYKSKIRVGKAFLDPVTQATAAHSRKLQVKPVDVYMVRVDCSTSDDKHMNPVVMWDFTATFEEFRTLEKNVRKEIKAKRLRNVNVPHLSSGAILFLQPELTPDVLAKRRERLQKFVTELCSDAILADCDAMRTFCQAF